MREFTYTNRKYATAPPNRNPKICSSWLAVFFLISTILSIPQISTAAETQDVLLLPLKINSAVDTEKYGTLSDRIIGDISTADGLETISRSKAQKILDYNTTWPPSFKKIQALSFAKNFAYIAAGTLTKSGDTFSVDISLYELHPKPEFHAGQKTSAVYFYKKTDSPDALTASLEKLLGEITTYANRHSLIATITIKGNKKIDTGAILNRVKNKPGDTYNEETVYADLKNIFQMGYFNDIEIDIKETDKGKAVSFIVKEKEIIKNILIEGDKELKETEIKEVITVKANKIFSSKELHESIDNIKKLYKEKGYYESKVTSALTYPKPDQVEVRFVIDEGQKVYVKEIKLLGNSIFSDRQLKKIMVTSEKGFFSWFSESGVLKRDMLEHDAARITAFYHDNGFIEAKVGAAEITQEKNWLYITFNISEGQQYGVGNIDVKGDLIDKKDILLDFIKLRNEKFFSRRILREDILRLTDFYAEKGFAFAEAFPAIEKNDANKTIDLVIDVKKSNLVMVNRIIIQGNTRTRDKVIRREMQIKEGGIFDSSALRKSNQKLQRLNFFEEVNVSPEPTLEENMMDVLVEVKEKPTGNFSIGAGYSSVDHMIFMAEVSQNNFLGRGQQLSLQANLSGNNTRYNLGFTEPHIFDSKLLTGIDLYNWERDYDDYTKDSQGFSLRFGYPVWEKWYMFWSYGYDDTLLTVADISTASSTIIDSMDINYTSYVRLGFQRDTRDKTFDASKGAHYSISSKYAGGPFGGDSAFTKVEGSTSMFFPTFWSTVFHVKMAAGYVEENTKDGKLPVYEKFYLGGINTIRGFNSGGISPTDPANGDKIGGNKMWYSNIEFIFPIAPSAGLKGLIFYDIGNVYDTNENWDFSNKKHSVGYGFRWLSPMGPLRLEWGYNLDPVDDEEQSSWDFTIGGSF